MHQAISAGHEITLAVAKEILLAKGNAFDAAIAAHYAMFITEPCMASAGGTGFALTKSAEGQTRFFDFFFQKPFNKKKKEKHQLYTKTVDF
jgi:gamma-glutamyltranspeptidase/glutathione hydrolase